MSRAFLFVRPDCPNCKRIPPGAVDLVEIVDVSTVDGLALSADCNILACPTLHVPALTLTNVGDIIDWLKENAR